MSTVCNRRKTFRLCYSLCLGGSSYFGADFRFFFYLSTLTAARWHTIETDVKRSIWSSAIQSADWRKMLHVINRGILINPVRRSDDARLKSSKFVVVLRNLFLANKIKASPLANKINIPIVIGGISSMTLKLKAKDWLRISEPSEYVVFNALDVTFRPDIVLSTVEDNIF